MAFGAGAQGDGDGDRGAAEGAAIDDLADDGGAGEGGEGALEVFAVAEVDFRLLLPAVAGDCSVFADDGEVDDPWVGFLDAAQGCMALVGVKDGGDHGEDAQEVLGLLDHVVLLLHAHAGDAFGLQPGGAKGCGAIDEGAEGEEEEEGAGREQIEEDEALARCGKAEKPLPLGWRYG